MTPPNIRDLIGLSILIQNAYSVQNWNSTLTYIGVSACDWGSEEDLDISRDGGQFGGHGLLCAGRFTIHWPPNHD